MKKVIFSFGRFGAKTILVKARLIYSGMNGNASFPDANPAMPAFFIKLEALELANTNAAKGGPEAKALKNQLLKEFKAEMRRLAMYVNVAANGDVVVLTSSGFTLAKTPAPIAVETPVIRQLNQAQNPGSMEMVIECKGAKDFIYKCALDNGDGNLQWQVQGGKTKKFVFTQLEQGKKYWFNVVAVGSKDQQVVSADVAQYVMQRNMI